MYEKNLLFFFSCNKTEIIVVQKEKTACIRELSD